MLTLQMLKEMMPDTIFATGTMNDSEDGLFMNGSNRELRWVAVRGGIHDWCIYCHHAEYDVEYIKRHGDKVCDKRNIKRVVECDDEAFKMYRY